MRPDPALFWMCQFPPWRPVSSLKIGKGKSNPGEAGYTIAYVLPLGHQTRPMNTRRSASCFAPSRFLLASALVFIIQAKAPIT